MVANVKKIVEEKVVNFIFVAIGIQTSDAYVSQ